MSETRDMSEEALRLDGNAAAGVLGEIFALEMTLAQCTCAHCGHVAPLGSLVLYGGQVGMVLRCPTCEQVQMRVVRSPERGGQYWIDLRGISILRVRSTPSA
jgi:Family of unknown function (DUF6510)